MKKWLPSLIGLSIFAMLGRLLGFVREMLIASSFGATDITDSYLTALILFDIAMAANASFLQGAFAYSAEVKSKEGYEKKLYKLGLRIFIIVLAAAVLFYPLAGYIIPLFYSHSPQANETIIKSAQLFFFLGAFLTASGVLAALLQMRGRLTNPGRLIVFLNVFSILFLIIFRSSEGIISIPIGFLAGGAAFLAYQLILLKRDREFNSAPDTGKDLKLKGWGAIAFLIYINALFPSMLGLLERYFAYSFPGGAFSHYQYSQKILQLPLTILSFAISTALLPVQVKSADAGDEEEFRSSTLNGIKISIVTSAFFAIIFYSMAEPVIQIVFKRGQFNLSDMYETASSLRILSLGLVPYLLAPVIANVFFSKKATRKLIAINLFFVLIQALSLTILTNLYPGIKALTVNWVAVVWLNNIILLFYLARGRTFIVPANELAKLLSVLAVAALIGIAARELLKPFFADAVNSASKAMLYFIAAGAGLLIIYSAFLIFLFRKEMAKIAGAIKGKIKK